MKMMVNIIKLSAFSIAEMSLGAAGPSPAATKNLQVNEPLLPQSPGSQKSEKPKNSSKPVSFLMEPTGGSESSYVVHGEKSHIDGQASAYIRKVHQKNLSDLSKSSNLPPYSLPPPPRAVMLTDFGLAKEIDESSRSNSMCGTTEYMAPEILLSKGHNKDADWWSVGILLYEMLTGQPPYTHANRQKLQQRIINEKVKLPPYLTSEAHSLIKGLLQKDPSKRLGSGPSGGDDIKHHKWFRSINWKKLEARELQPKFKPDVSGKDCTANFDRCWTTMPLDDSPAPTPTAGEHFQGYSYVAPNPWLSSE